MLAYAMRLVTLVYRTVCLVAFQMVVIVSKHGRTLM